MDLDFTWTTFRPTEPGWYWADPGEAGEPYIVQVAERMVENGILRWAGPIPAPWPTPRWMTIGADAYRRKYGDRRAAR